MFSNLRTGFFIPRCLFGSSFLIHLFFFILVYSFIVFCIYSFIFIVLLNILILAILSDLQCLGLRILIILLVAFAGSHLCDL